MNVLSSHACGLVIQCLAFLWICNPVFKKMRSHGAHNMSIFLRVMYWTKATEIKSASMDGQSTVTLHSSGLNNPYGLTIDYKTQTLYWTNTNHDRIERSSFTGNNRIVLSQLASSFYPFGITYYNGTVYWSDTRRDSIHFSINNQYTYALPIDSDAYDLTVLSESRQPQGT